MLTAGNWRRADTEERGEWRRAFECDDCGHVEVMPKGRPREPHGCPKGPREGEAVTYTTAGPEYDWFGTRDLGVAGRDSRGRDVRRVAGPEGRAEDQRARYGSGNHLAVTEDGWRELVAFRLATEAGPPSP